MRQISWPRAFRLVADHADVWLRIDVERWSTYFESRSDYDPSQVTTGWNVEAGLQYQAGTQTFAPYFQLTGDPGEGVR